MIAYGGFFLLGIIVATLMYKNILHFRIELTSKLGLFYRLLVKWVILKQKNVSIKDYFIDRNVHSIAVYGMKEIGELICSELENTEVVVKYAIDKNADHFFSDVVLFKPNDDLDSVDMVVVTVLVNNKKLIDELEKKLNCPVVTIMDVVSAFKVD